MLLLWLGVPVIAFLVLLRVRSPGQAFWGATYLWAAGGMVLVVLFLVGRRYGFTGDITTIYPVAYVATAIILWLWAKRRGHL